MEEFNVKEIWKSKYSGPSAEGKYSFQDIQAFKQKQSSRAFRSSRLTILFDICFKGLFIVTLAYLWIISSAGRLYSVGIPMLLIVLLIVWEWYILKKLPAPHIDEAVVAHLEKHLHYLKTKYQAFIFCSALTSVLLVYTGFLYNYHFKYERASLPSPFEDWVIYAFLAAAFGFSYIAQKKFHRVQIGDIIDSIRAIEEDSTAEQHLNYLQKERKRNWMIAVLLVLLGVLFLTVILLT